MSEGGREQDKNRTVVLRQVALDRLMPMHLLLSKCGHVLHAGPTLDKILPNGLKGRAFLDVFEMRRPRNVTQVEHLSQLSDGRLHLVLRDDRNTSMKGHALPTEDGAIMLNLSFGISMVETIGKHNLTAADFAPTDLTVEMLYLAEAKSAVLQESLQLNQRLQDAKQAAEEQAVIDALTGLGNRRAMDRMLAQLVARGVRFGMLNLDLDYFKDVNDTLGHAAGDHVLQKVAQVLREQTRAQDAVARVGGDEFVIIFQKITDRKTLSDLSWRIIRSLEEPIWFGRRRCRISGSIGITTSDKYANPDPDRMLSDADEALYASKHAGRATVTFFGDAPDHKDDTPPTIRSTVGPQTG